MQLSPNGPGDEEYTYRLSYPPEKSSGLESGRRPTGSPNRLRQYPADSKPDV